MDGDVVMAAALDDGPTLASPTASETAAAMAPQATRRGRVVSAACFRVLSLQLERQNEVDVLKPILEELEVLRLSCVLGALPTVNPKDFEFDMLEAKEFDDDFARFLRADVFGGASHAQDRPSVRVVGLFGKQPQVTSQLASLGGWDDAMEAKLCADDLGLYAVVLPSTEDANGIKTVAVFPWLVDEYFQVDRLRETPAYLLRLLTCVTSHVTCCFSGEDKTLMEQFNTRDDEMGEGSDEEWRSYSAAFHVEQQQDAKDDVTTTEIHQLPLPALCKLAYKLDVVKGSTLALMAVAKSPASKEKTASQRKYFSTPADFCDWLLEQSEHFDLRVVVSGLTDELAEAVLRRCDEWPDDELEDIQVTCVMRERLAESNIQKAVSEETERILAEWRAAGEEMFHMDALLDPAIIEDAVSAIKARVRELESSDSFTLTSEAKRTLCLPGRLPKMIKRFEELFENGHEQLLNEALERAPVTLAKEMEQSPAKRGITGALRSFLTSWVRDSSQVSDAFRQRMQEPLQSMKLIWWAEVSSTYAAFAKAKVAELLESQVFKLRSARSTAHDAAVNSAFKKLLDTWSESEMNGLSIHITVQHRLGRTIICSYEEEVLLPTHDRIYLWAYKPSLPRLTDHDFAMMGRLDLHEGEELRGIFTIQSRSALVVVVRNGHTIVRRAEFLQDRRNHRQTIVGQIREIARPSLLCDYYNKERLLVLVDPSGKAGVYRFDEKFKSMETIRTLNLTLTSLVMPLKDMVLSDGILYMVDHEGAMQSLNTRNQQTSRKKHVGYPRSCGGYEDEARLVRVLDGGILGWIDVNPESTVTKIVFVASEDMRELPQANCARFPFSKSGLVYEAMDDILLVVDEAHGNMRAIKMTASLKSESYRIRSINGIRSGDTVVNGMEADEKAEAQMLSQHWLWTFYHLYEKFPVRGELFRSATGAARRILELSFVCDSEHSHSSEDFDDGCQKLLGLIMEKLQLLNKPLYGLDLAGSQISIACGTASRAAIVDEYVRVEPQSVATLLRELATFVPLQICRAEFNSLTLMSDGQYKSHDETSAVDGTSSLSSADIALKLRFGLLSPLLSSWSRQCIVVTSMGKQSTGKSYFLNHLTGSSFAISGARCTDGAWMSVRFLPNGVMLVVIDFEGLGSFERTEQEDVFLSVLNASVSMLTIFRMEMRLDKEIDDLFSKFQKGSQLIKNDPQLFRGKLYMSVKDVNPNDQRGVVGEFVAKFQRLL